jgi:hypothetical protein
MRVVKAPSARSKRRGADKAKTCHGYPAPLAGVREAVGTPRKRERHPSVIPTRSHQFDDEADERAIAWIVPTSRRSASDMCFELFSHPAAPCRRDIGSYPRYVLTLLSRQWIVDETVDERAHAGRTFLSYNNAWRILFRYDLAKLERRMIEATYAQRRSVVAATELKDRCKE